MPLPSLKPTSKSITLLIIAAAILLFGTLFTYFGCSSKLKSAAAELDGKQKEVDNSRRIAQRLSEAEVKFAQTKAQLQYLETSVTTQAYVPTLLKQLETLGEEVKLKVISVRPASQVALQQPVRKLSTDATNPEAAEKQMDQNAQKPANQGQQGQQGQGQAAAAKPKPYDALTIDVEVEGSYWNTMSFLYRITSFPKIMSVNYVQLSPYGQVVGMQSPSLNVRFNLTAFVFREEPKPTPPPSGSVSVTSRAQPDWRHKNEAG